MSDPACLVASTEKSLHVEPTYAFGSAVKLVKGVKDKENYYFVFF